MSKIKIGWASRDVSTDKKLDLPGQFYMRISEGVLDPITVNCLVMDTESDMLIFLSADLVNVYGNMLDEILDRVHSINSEIPLDKIVMNMTHSHTTPALNFIPEDLPPHECLDIDIEGHAEYHEFYVNSCAEAICEAYDKRAEGGYAYGFGYAVVANSRRVMYFDDLSKRPGADPDSSLWVDGHVAMYGETNDDMFSGYEAGADHLVNILYTFDMNKNITGAIINLPCPSQNSEGQYLQSADFWHNIRENIRAKYGDIYILPQCAAAGDLAPHVLHYREALGRRFELKYSDREIDCRLKNKYEYQIRLDIAERVAACFDEVYSWAEKDIIFDSEITHINKEIKLSKWLITDEEYAHCKSQLKRLEKEEFNRGRTKEEFEINCTLVCQRERFNNIVKRYESQKDEPMHTMELHVIKLGDIAFATNQFELYMDYQHRIQARSPFMQTFIVQLCAQRGKGSGSYLATERGKEGMGYSAIIYSCTVSPEGGQQLVEETISELKNLYNK